jgi:amidase
MPVDATIDHVGVLTGTVAENALFLEVVAGEDGLDYRQHSPVVGNYQEATSLGAQGLRVALLREGFRRPESEPDVDASVSSAADRLVALGCEVEEVSIPWHLHALSLWAPICIEGTYYTMWLNGGVGANCEGVYVTSFVKALSDLRQRADELPDTLRVVSVFANYVHRYHSSRFYAKAQNLRRRLRAAYDDVLRDHDLILLPTTPMKPSPIPSSGASFDEVMAHSWSNIGNTCAFDVTGHPAITVPCGMSDGLPIGMMLVGAHFNESTLYRAANAFEQSVDWQEV